MTRGIGDVEGWPAVEWVVGMGAVMLVTAGVLWYRSRAFHDAPAEAATYRTAETPGSGDGAELRAISVVILVLCVVSQLLYLGVYIELAQWLLGGLARPRISGDLFFWVVLVNGTCAGASLYTALKKTKTNGGASFDGSGGITVDRPTTAAPVTTTPRQSSRRRRIP